MSRWCQASVKAALAFLVCVAGGGAAPKAPGRHAVLIGINDYADRLIPDLKCAEADAKAMHKVLTDPTVGMFPPDNVKLLVGRDATPRAIKQALNGLRAVNKDDLVLVFFSGHGAKEGDQSFWVTQDAELGDLTSTALSNREVKDILDRIPSQRLVVLLDCCYAAATVKDNKAIVDAAALWEQFSGTGRVVISGAGDAEEALEMPDVGLGVFTHFLNPGPGREGRPER
jgi:uncharacterized caspase-like protein